MSSSNIPGRPHPSDLSKALARKNAQLAALNEANLLLSEERLVSSVLQRVVDISRELSGAQYAALGVLDDNGQLKSFLTSGIDEAAREAIGELPSGKGLLGLMLDRSEPLRADNISKHPNSVGFPSGHPPMTSFLGVPIWYKKRGGLVCLNSAAGLISGIALPCVRPLRTRQALCQRTGPASFPQGSNGAVRHCKTRSTARVQFWLPGPIRRLSGTPPRT